MIITIISGIYSKGTASTRELLSNGPIERDPVITFRFKCTVFNPCTHPNPVICIWLYYAQRSKKCKEAVH